METKYHSEQWPGVGVGILVLYDTGDEIQILLGKRKGSHAAGEYSFPGGWVEHGESLIDCAVREVYEETGLVIDSNEVEELDWEECFDYMPKHIINFGYYVFYTGAEEPKLMEPDKCEGWDWYPIDDLPEPVGVLAKRLIDYYNEL